MPYQTERRDFVGHPEGTFEGIIIRWIDLGWKPSQYGPRHKAYIGIECSTKKTDDGNPYLVNDFVPVAFGSSSILQKRRVAILGRSLTPEEERRFDPREELIGVRISYMVVHNPKEDGTGVWVNVATIMRLADQDGHQPVNDFEVNETPPQGFEKPVPVSTPIVAQTETPTASGDLPF